MIFLAFQYKIGILEKFLIIMSEKKKHIWTRLTSLSRKIREILLNINIFEDINKWSAFYFGNRSFLTSTSFFRLK
jgi:hypothetical protein